MAHGYLREYDEGPDRGDDRERGRQDWRDRDRDRGFMFDERDRGIPRNRDDEHSAFSSNDRQKGRGNFRSHPDDHYRSWRDQQMQALDRDYADYCREREQQFHRDFDSWRQNRQQPQGGQRQQQGLSQNQDELILGAEHGGLAAGTINEPVPSGESQATLGTNNPENSTPGRGGRR